MVNNDMETDIKKIAEIFTPWINAIIEKKLKHEPVLYHYTNIEALFNGILVKDSPKEGEEISLYATDHRYLNDIEEIKGGCKRLKEKLGPMLEGIINEDTDFDELFDKDEPRYIISFSLNPDSIPMWSTYGRRGNGIALGFDTKKLVSSIKDIHPCIYTEKDMDEALKLLHDKTNFDSENALFFVLYACLHMVNLIKDSSYEYEKEIRFLSVQVDVKDRKYRYANNLIIPYIQKFLPKEALKTITIGPNLNTEMVKRSVREYIDSLGFKDVEIKISDVPFRTL